MTTIAFSRRARVALSLALTLTLVQIGAGASLAAQFPDPVFDPARTERASSSIIEVQGNDRSFGCDMTPDGRFVVFLSEAANLVPFDTNGFRDVFVRDRQVGSTERVNVSSVGVQGNGNSDFVNRPCAISDDGRFVAFASSASNLVPGDTNGRQDIFVRDRQAETTTRISGAGGGFSPAISGDGRLVAFESEDALLVPGDTNGVRDVFLRERATGAIERISLSGAKIQGNGDSSNAALSGDGRFVAFQSFASNLVPGDTNSFEDIFVRDRVAGTTERVSVDSGGGQGNNNSSSPTLSADGRFIVFGSFATNLVPGSSGINVLLRDRQAGTTERVSVGPDGTGGHALFFGQLDVTPDGRYVLFSSTDGTLVAGDTNSQQDAFVRDRQLGITLRISVGPDGVQGNAASSGTAISADGRLIAFESDATNLVSNDTNSDMDVFVRDRCFVCQP